MLILYPIVFAIITILSYYGIKLLDKGTPEWQDLALAMFMGLMSVAASIVGGGLLILYLIIIPVAALGFLHICMMPERRKINTRLKPLDERGIALAGLWPTHYIITQPFNTQTRRPTENETSEEIELTLDLTAESS